MKIPFAIGDQSISPQAAVLDRTFIKPYESSPDRLNPAVLSELGRSRPWSMSLQTLAIAPQATQHLWSVWGAAVFLVSVPVFFQAPLVRLWPELSLVLTLAWLAVSLLLLKQQTTQGWGDLLLGFTWSWLAGAIYWGWFRWEPLLHLPIEAIGLPFALLSLWRGWNRVGSSFYLGSLLGTALTDGFFYLTGLIPYWRTLMLVETSEAASVLHHALDHLKTPAALGWAIVILTVLLMISLPLLKTRHPIPWAFSGAVLSTIFVDLLFGLAALFA